MQEVIHELSPLCPSARHLTSGCFNRIVPVIYVKHQLNDFLLTIMNVTITEFSVIVTYTYSICVCFCDTKAIPNHKQRLLLKGHSFLCYDVARHCPHCHKHLTFGVKWHAEFLTPRFPWLMIGLIKARLWWTNRGAVQSTVYAHTVNLDGKISQDNEQKNTGLIIKC